MGPLKRRALVGLSQYQYKSGGLTWLDHLHAPAWNALVARLPMWLAPNLITLIGTMAVVLAWLLSVALSPDYHSDLPAWVPFLCGLAVVIYVNLDCIDGKQARRTGSSSPLGQLFDHGCDALSLHLLLDTVRASMHLAPHSAIIFELAVMVPWMLAHWEEYHTGVMLYGNGYFGVLEGNYLVALIQWITAAFGPGFWKHAVLPASLWPDAFQRNNNVGFVMLVGVAVGAMVSAAGQLHRVMVFSPTSLTTKERGFKQLGNGAAFLHLTYVALLIGLGYMFLYVSVAASGGHTPDAVNSKGATEGSNDATGGAWGASSLMYWVGGADGLAGRVLSMLQAACERYHLRVVGATWGLVYALVATQLILAHMSKEPFAPFAWALAVLALGCANSQMQAVPPALLDALLMVVTFVGYTYCVVSIVNQICAYLDISCFKVRAKPREA